MPACRLPLLLSFLVGLTTACNEPRKQAPEPEPPKPKPHPPTQQQPPPPAEQSGPTPHPDYPTPAAAGTEKIFYLEEPDRGPKVTPVTLPAAASLKWRTAAHCEPHETGIACSAAAGPLRWRIGSRAGKIVVAERRGGKQLQETYLFERDAAGTLSRITRLDGRGNIEWSRFIDAAKQHLGARNLNGSNALPGCGQLAYKLDGAGHPTELSCLQWTGKPMRDIEGVRVRRFKRDTRGFVVEETRVTPRGDPMADNDGVHRKQYRRDAQGRPLEERYLDIEGHPTMSADSGCHGWRLEYNASGDLVRRTCLGAGGKPTAGQSGAHAEAFERDHNGCVLERRHLDAEGKPTRNRHGVYGTRHKVNHWCQDVTMSCVDVRGKLMSCGPRRPARYLYSHDRRGYLISTKHYVAGGRPGKDPDYSVFEVRHQRDALGNVTSDSCFSPRGQAVLCDGTGMHRSVTRFDEAGRQIDRRFFDPQGGVTTNLGCAIRRYRHDNYDHEVEAADHDAQGKVIESMGKAFLRTLYDQSHRRFAVLLLDKEQRPARYAGCFTGVTCPSSPWHAVRIVRDRKGAVVKNLYFDADQQLVQSVDCLHNRCWD